MNVLAVLLFAVAVAVQALPQNVTPARNIIHMEKRMPTVPGHPEPAVGRIVGGSAASYGQFPHQAFIFINYISPSYAMCGGSLISTSVVLTAGHCVLPEYESFTVLLGGLQFEGEESGRVTIETTSRAIHPDYNSLAALNNDVGLIFLGTDVPLSDRIQLVNLPSRSQVGNSFAGQSATMSGWGRTSQDGVISQTLQYATLNVISNSDCALVHGDAVIFSSTLCAKGPNGESTCGGDAGGALVIGSQGNYTQIGIGSFLSWNGCDSGDPTGFARVTSFLDWISSTAGVTIS